ncbi:hypothetical protein G8E05_06270 [Clostridium botulinum]|uniref:hypothetical protein n=1 Tax=Clostridium botulinum TaxID=1491 RepID=UPI00035BA751|nr:hypothetical protein [Clostridium botulinum]AJD28433.1 hypothetical protein T257_3101 [Clostridium botulinum CDC_297]EPS50174.1 hypothetical protein CFSAN002368_15003 [Clostridium botulinum A1 str. CFSAN002368]APU61240.1 hypothetical protein NPD8_3199 [Clostridium botulinum]MBY6871628.1 hypothetical protein [Clostridium botulinum]MBY6877720.1 hypothetical protein [Clostridium botulinum]
MLVKFKNIGHSKKNFEKEIEEINYEEMLSCVTPYCCSSASSIWFSFANKEKTKGNVNANFHTVGYFEIVC